MRNRTSFGADTAFTYHGRKRGSKRSIVIGSGSIVHRLALNFIFYTLNEFKF